MAETTRGAQPADREAEVEAAVLNMLLVLHPVQLTLAEPVRELDGETPQLEDALRRLVAAGLVHRHGEFLFPTRTAVYHEALFERRG